MSQDFDESKRERPSVHGAILGHALAQLAEAGRRSTAEPIPDPCLTCAFRPGCMTNQMAATGLAALNCAIGVDKDDFGCHHGLKDGAPTRPCNGWLAAKKAPWPLMKEIIGNLAAHLNQIGDGDDAIRAEFDAWRGQADPAYKLDDYALARLYAKERAA